LMRVMAGVIAQDVGEVRVAGRVLKGRQGVD